MSTPIIENNEVVEPKIGEVKGKVLNADEITAWGNDTQITEPIVKREDGSEVKSVVDESPAVVEPETPTAPEPEVIVPQITVEDPGEFTPEDYSFTVTTYNEESKKPKNVKITSVEQWDELLEQDPNLGSPAALLKADRAAAKMESNQERDKSNWETAKEAYDIELERVNQSEQTTQTWANEIDYLTERGDLPKIDPKFENVLWVGPNADKEALKDESVKARVELLEYLKKENTSRKSRGISLMGPVDAYNAMQLDTRRKSDIDTKKQADEARKAAGARVAGSTPSPVTTTPKGIAVGRAGSLRDLVGGWNR